MTTYELWWHELLGAYGVRLEQGQVTGVCGPIPLSRVDNYDPAELAYDARPEAILRAQDSPEQFCLLEAWRKGEWVSAVPAARPGPLRRALAWLYPPARR